MHQEGAAADAGALRFDQREHRLGGDGGIDRAAAGAQHFKPGARGVRIGGGDHMPSRRFGGMRRRDNRQNGDHRRRR